MKLHCLGTTGYHPCEHRHTSCYFLPSSGIVLDAGTGIYRLADFIETDHLDILLSHAHLDHVIGLTFLLDVVFQRPVSELRVWGESEKIEAIKTHLFSEHLFPVTPDVQWCTMEADHVIKLEGGAMVFPFALEHPGGSLGFRIEFPDRKMAYVTDTTATATSEYVDQIRDVDLLLHECNFRSHQNEWAEKTGHSSADFVGQVAARSGAKQTWLTHINPLELGEDPVGIADVQRHTPAIDVASDMQVIEF